MALAGRTLLMLLICALVAACQTNRVIRRVGAFGNSYIQIVTSPYVYGSGEFCGSSVTSADGSPYYSVFTRATEAECKTLIGSFDVRSQSLDPFPGRPDVFLCNQTGAYECEQATALEQELATRFSRGGGAAVGAEEGQVEYLSEFFASNGRLVTRVLFGFQPRRPLNLECAVFVRHLEGGHAWIDVIACRDRTRSWVVDVALSEE